MAKKALINKAQRKPKFSVRNIIDVRFVAVHVPLSENLGYAEYAFRKMASQGVIPGGNQSQLVVIKLHTFGRA